MGWTVRLTLFLRSIPIRQVRLYPGQRAMNWYKRFVMSAAMAGNAIGSLRPSIRPQRRARHGMDCSVNFVSAQHSHQTGSFVSRPASNELVQAIRNVNGDGGKRDRFASP